MPRPIRSAAAARTSVRAALPQVESLERRQFLSVVPSVTAILLAAHATVTRAAATTASTWQTRAPDPTARFEAMGAAVGGKLYVFGGFYNSQLQATNRAEVYDPATNTWGHIADMPGAQTHVGTATDGTNIYFAGGFQGRWKGPGPASSALWIYNVPTNNWRQGPSLPAAVGAGGLVWLNGQLHFFGGLFSDGKTDSANQWVYTPGQAGGWTRRAPLPDPRNHIGYAAVGGKIYVIGGQHGLQESSPDRAVHAYDPSTDRWQAVASLPAPRSHVHNTTFVYNGQIYCVGGSITGDQSSNRVLRYDPAANTWTTVTFLPAPRSAAVAQVIGSQLYVTTGTPTGVLPQSTTWSMAL